MRVSLGHVLRVPFGRVDSAAAVGALGFTLFALTPDPAAPSLNDVEVPERVALLLGAEGPGLSADALAAADQRVRIPMAAGVDSLNVATAAAVALYALRSAVR